MTNIIKQIEEQKKLIEDIKDYNAFDLLDDWIAEEEKKLAELEAIAQIDFEDYE